LRYLGDREGYLRLTPYGVSQRNLYLFLIYLFLIFLPSVAFLTKCFLALHSFSHSLIYYKAGDRKGAPLHSFTHSLILSFTHSLIYYKVDDRKGAPLHSFTHLLILSFTHSLIPSFIIRWTTARVRPYTHSLIYSFTYSLQGGRPQRCAPTLIYSFTHLLIHYKVDDRKGAPLHSFTKKTSLKIAKQPLLLFYFVGVRCRSMIYLFYNRLRDIFPRILLE